MSVKSSQSITVEFVTSRFDTGALSDADSTPTGTLVINGTNNGATVTVTNISTGRYKAAVTLPSLSAADIVEIYIAATVNSVAGGNVVWRDTCDLAIDASGFVTFANTSIATATTLTNAPSDSSGVTTLLSRIGGAITISGGIVSADAVKLDGDATAADMLREFYAGCKLFAVDDTDFTPTTTVFECDSTDDYDKDWTKALIWWTSGANAGTTQFVTTYAFADGRVKLTVSEMEVAPSDGDKFIRMGRSR